MQTIKVIKSQARTGQTVEYRISEHLDQISVEVHVDGKRKAGGTPKLSGETVQGHYIYGQIAKVYITKEDIWNEIWVAYTDAKEQLESSDEYKVKQLRERRQRLALDMKIAQDELYEAEYQRIERAGMGEAYRYDSDGLEQAVAEATDALKAFDDEHPEIIALIKKERDESVERNRWM